MGILLQLTSNQLEAVEHFKGPAQVVAGPGSGKTLVLTKRVEYLVNEKNIPPEEIIVTTFTEKAANELKVRLSEKLGEKATRIQISTIHSLCKSLLEEYSTHHDLAPELEVLDSEAQKLFVDTNKFKLGIFRRKGSNYKWLKENSLSKSGGYESDFVRLYNFLTRNEVDPDELRDLLENEDRLSEEDEKIIHSYEKYLNILEEEDRIDFANLQLRFYKLISENEDLLKEVQDQFEFILVDEYQDTSPLQDKIFRKIAPPQNNIFVVGDVDQSIYGFRGASAKNFKRLEDRFGNVETYPLKDNFRSTEHIVELSNDLIEKELKARRRKGEKSVVLKEETTDSVAEKSIDLIKDMHEKGIIEKYGDVALLFRSWYHAKEYEKYLKQEDIPYNVMGGGGFFDREEITTLVYLISYVTRKLSLGSRFKNWDDWWDVKSFKSEVLGFSEETKKALDDLPSDSNIYDYETPADLKEVGISDESDNKKIVNLNELRQEIENSDKGEKSSLLEIFYDILEATGYLNRLLEREDAKSEEKLYNLARLSRIIKTFEEITGGNKAKNFLWFIYNSARNDAFEQEKIEDENAVKLMTVHKAKGLEFPVVFMCSLLEGRFPLNFRKDKYVLPLPEEFYRELEELKKEEEEFYEEEKRLFYVGITRAQENLIFTTSDKITSQRKEESRFLKEIGEHVSKDRELNKPIEEEYESVEETPDLSYSAINTYIDCPFRYNLAYRYDFATPRIFMQNVGTFVHNLLQRIHFEIENGKELSPDEIESLVEDYWISVYHDDSKDEKLKMKYLEKAKSYYEKIKPFYEEIIAIEEPFSYIDENMILNGQVDLIVKDKNGNTDLIDFKARKAEGIEETNVDKQLKIYNYCLRSEYDIDKLIAYTFEDNKKIEFEPEEEWVKNFLEKTTNRIEEKEFNRKVGGAFCDKCRFKFCCEDSL